MRTTFTFIIASMALFSATMANPAASVMGVETFEEDGFTSVREAPYALSKRSCTNCVHVGDHCVIGEGNCYATENALCTDCKKQGKGIICVDQDGGSCKAP